MFSESIEQRLNELQPKERCKVLGYVAELAQMPHPISAETLATYSELPGGIGPYVIDEFADWLMNTVRKIDDD